MRWQGRDESSNVEDRRGMGGLGVGLPVGGGIGGLVILLIISAITGTNPLDLISSSSPTSGTVGTSGPPDDEQGRFVSVVLRDTEETWGEIFRGRGERYVPPVLVLYTDATQTGCGVGKAVMGPFYCPQDRKVYLDLSFFQELAQRFGAPGDFARAYVVAHEVGHHVQTLLGLTSRVDAARSGASARQANAVSVRVELQADCYAGVWGRYAATRGLLEPGDAEEGLRAAAAIGDDTLQRETEGRVVPDSFTHGTSAQRVRWLKTGLDSGRVEACDTFSGAD